MNKNYFLGALSPFSLRSITFSYVGLFSTNTSSLALPKLQTRCFQLYKQNYSFELIQAQVSWVSDIRRAKETACICADKLEPNNETKISYHLIAKLTA